MRPASISKQTLFSFSLHSRAADSPLPATRESGLHWGVGSTWSWGLTRNLSLCSCDNFLGPHCLNLACGWIENKTGSQAEWRGWHTAASDRLFQEGAASSSLPYLRKSQKKNEQKYAQAFDESTVQCYYCIYWAALSSPYCSANAELSVAWWILRIFALSLSIVLQSMAGVQQCSRKVLYPRVSDLSPANQGKICAWREALFIHFGFVYTSCLPTC